MLNFRAARNEDLPDLIRLPGDGQTGFQRDIVTNPLADCYREVFKRVDALRFYRRLGFVASHQGLKLRLSPPTAI